MSALTKLDLEQAARDVSRRAFWQVVDEWVGPDPDHGHYRLRFVTTTADYVVESEDGYGWAALPAEHATQKLCWRLHELALARKGEPHA
jgi:hypothetical protein